MKSSLGLGILGRIFLFSNIYIKRILPAFPEFCCMRYFDLLPRLVTESGYKTLLVKTEEIRIEKQVRKIEN